MQSKTSFFNKTIFKKNLTRFAPVWVLYTICLVVGLFLLYTEGRYSTDVQRKYYFVSNVADMISIMGIANLGYGLLVAQLLFGDLYNSRMCNMLHALPLRRETWFVTNIASGLTFSLVPTAVVTAVSLPLLSGSIVENAWQIGLLWFAAVNLEYICCFGLAAFAAMCVGNRFTMVAGYGLLNAGASIAYWLIDTLYTPLLYGIVTPTTLYNNLTPLAHMVNFSFVDVESSSELMELLSKGLEDTVVQFTVTEHWWRLGAVAAAGVVFLAAALLLYRKRDLECAGDAVAFKVLVPVFQVLCSLFVMAAVQFFLYSMLGLRQQNYLILALGLAIGWFIGKMLLERSTRVFRLKNWYGLGVLAAVLAVTLVGTHFDVLNIEERMPEADRIEKVHLSCSNGNYLEEEADIQNILRLHQMALEERVEESGIYVPDANGGWTCFVEEEYYARTQEAGTAEETGEDLQYRYAVHVGLRYELKNGNTVRREYNIWVDSPAGELAESYLNRWEFVNQPSYIHINDEDVDRLEMVRNTFENVMFDYADQALLKQLNTREDAEGLLAALKADCEAGNMAQNFYFHSGHFRRYDEDYENGYVNNEGLWVGLHGERYSWDVMIYPDSENTIRWLTDHGLMENIDVRPEAIPLW